MFAPGLAILCGVFDALAIKELRLSDGAPREGVLYEMEGRFRHQDIRDRTAQSLANQYNIDREQARRVLETTTHIFEQWQEQNPKLDNPNLSALLKWAVMLHEVGLNINHSGMHRHSAYILQNSDLPGFNQEQQMLMATLVRYHRKAIKLDDLPALRCLRKAVPAAHSAFTPWYFAEQPASGDHHTAHAQAEDRSQSLDAGLPARLVQPECAGAARSGKEQQYWEGVPDWLLKIAEEEPDSKTSPEAGLLSPGPFLPRQLASAVTRDASGTGWPISYPADNQSPMTAPPVESPAFPHTPQPPAYSSSAPDGKSMPRPDNQDCWSANYE